MNAFLLNFVISLALIVSLAAAQSSEADAYTDSELFAAVCAQKDVIWVRADLDLREEHWPADCKAPVVLQRNMTISGPMDQPLNFTVSFNFMARKVVIPPYGEVRLRRFTARNTRRGGGGEIDFIAYSPRGILWTDDLNKNQIICIHADPRNLVALPLPVGFPEFANRSQIVSLWGYCTPTRCWDEVLHYEQFFTDVNVGSDTQTGGYVMAKRNASKTCDEFVTAECLAEKGGEACMQQVITDFMAQQQPASDGGRGGVSPLVIALPVALGGAALLAVIITTATVLSRRTRRRREAVEAAAAAAARAKLADLECAGGGGGGGAGRGSRGGGLVHGRKDVDSGSTGSKDIVSGSCSGTLSGSYSGDELQRRMRPRLRGEEEELGGGGGGIQDSFRYETQDDMGRCLSGRRGGGGPSSSLHSGSCSGGVALVEGTMQDGSVCTITIGPPLGQGSYGVVFKGAWRDRLVAVKLIMCDPTSSEQVATEVRLMTSEACRHPNLLRAYAYMARTRVVNRQQPAGQALQSAIRSLTGSSARRHPTGSAADVLADSGMSSNGTATEQAETWIVSEYCDLGALAPHVHGAKRFLFPPDTTASTTGAGAGAVAVMGAAGVELRRPRLPLILSCLRDIAGGMAHLHSLNIVHGDLKLANVLLSSRPAEEDTTTTTVAAAESGRAEDAAHGQALPAGGSESSVTLPTTSSTSGLIAMQLPPDLVAKVADFGLSRWLKEGQTHHSTKTVGTVTHMPPELLRSGKLTLSGDVYSFGIIMWELLTGSVPYRGLMYGEVVERVVVSHRRPEFPENTPPKYRALAERCWAAEAAARPTFAAVLYEVEELMREAAGLQADSDKVLAEMMAAAAQPPPMLPPGADGGGEVAAGAGAVASASSAAVAGGETGSGGDGGWGGSKAGPHAPNTAEVLKTSPPPVVEGGP